MTTDRVAGGSLVLFALMVMWESRRLPLGTLHNPGPAYAPVLLAIILLVFGAIVALRGAAAPRLGAVGWSEWPHAVAILGSCAFGALALERLGYRLTMAVAMLFLLGIVERKSVVLTIAFAVLMAWGSFFVFDTLLRVPLPRGPVFGI